MDELIEVLKKKFCRKFDEDCRDYYLRLIRFCQRMHVAGMMACRHAADALYEQCAVNNVPVCKPPPTSCSPSTSAAGVS